MKKTNEKYQLQYIKLGIPSNIGKPSIGYVLRIEKFESLKEVQLVMKQLTRTGGFNNYGNVLINKRKQIKINLQVH